MLIKGKTKRHNSRAVGLKPCQTVGKASVEEHLIVAKPNVQVNCQCFIPN